MAINIQNLVAAANAKIGVAAVDAADSARLASLTNFVNNHRNTQTFASIASLPTADSSNFGQIVRIAANSAGTYLDSGSSFYVSYVNQWKQVLFSGDSDVAQTAPVTSTQAQGSNFGYTSGGFETSPGSAPTYYINVIQKFSFTSDGNGTDVGDMTTVRNHAAGQSSSSHGYTSGGQNPAAPNARLNIIDKFPFSSDANATDVGDLTVARYAPAGNTSTTHGYSTGGNDDPSVGNVIDKFPFSSDANATDVGDLTDNVFFAAGQSSTTHGYSSGNGQPAETNVIEKFPFATDTNASDVGDLTEIKGKLAGQNSTTHGYTSGGRFPPTLPVSNVIEKFPFATDTNASDVGDLTVGRYSPAGQSSTESGYTSGGVAPPYSDIIDKFSFSSDANATDVGDLARIAGRGPAGQQY